MKTTILVTLFAGGIVALSGCNKTKPVSTTTTHSDTTTESDNGDKKSVHTTEVNELQPDGSEKTSTTVKTDSNTPPPPATPRR